MTNTLQLSSRLYGRLLVLYPDDLRRDFGAEMALDFAEDLETAHRDAGLRGILRVWYCTLAEFLRFALPGHASSPAVRVPAISLAFFVAATCGQITLEYCHRVPSAPEFFHSLSVALILPILATPVFSLLAVWACRGDGAISLDLSDPPRRKDTPCSKYGI